MTRSQTTRRQYAVRSVRVRSSERYLVLAPHPDDEVIGCGGTLAHASSLSAQIGIVYFTSGADSARIGDVRRQEAVVALEILGVRALSYWMNSMVGSVGRTGRSERLAEIVKSFAPTTVLLPWFGDNHSDHRGTNIELLHVRNCLPDSTKVLAYEVWTPAPTNVIQDITEYADVKRQAIRAHVTQERQWRLSSMALSLNRFRATNCLPPTPYDVQYAEAFLGQSMPDYLDSAARMLYSWVEEDVVG